MYERDYFGLGDLGLDTTFITGSATPSSGANQLVQQALNAVPVVGPLLSQITNFLHIGAGRNEADQIVPTQNTLGDYLAKVSAFIDTTSSVPALQKVAQDLANQWASFQDFIGNRMQFPDGRASAGAYNTIAPIVNSIQQRIATRISALGGSGWNPLQILQGAGGWGLDVPTYGEPTITQAGMLTYYPPVANVQQAGIGSSLLPFLIAGGAAFLFTRRRG